MFEYSNLTREAYVGFLEQHNEDECEAFAALVAPIVDSFCAKNGLAAIDPDTVEHYAGVLWDLANEVGISGSLPKGEKGEPQSLDVDRKTELITELLERLDDSEAEFELAHVGNYLLAALLQPEFANCRLSYCKANEEGEYRRQNLDYCKKRISGSHCVDCPLFMQTEPEKHPQILQMQWKAMDDSELHQNLEVFLPEEFRQFRYFLHLHRQYAGGAGENEAGAEIEEMAAAGADESGFEDIGIEDEMDLGEEDWG